MAYNFRPKNANEILSKNKKNGFVAAKIYEVILKKYDAIIVLDPSTQFDKIKIPRAVGENHTITVVKQFLKSQSVDLGSVSISFGDGSGRSTGTDATATKLQENSTRLYCQTYMTSGKFPSNEETRKVYPNVNDEWFETFEAQAIAINKWLGSKDYDFSRDEGIMPFLEDIALKKCGVRAKDSWNPADIYAVKIRSEAEIRKALFEIGERKMGNAAKLDALNSYMRSKIATKELVGISLKKLLKGKVKTVELTNAKKKEPLSDIEILAGSIKLNLDINAKNEFVTGDFSMKIKAEGKIVAVQVRAFAGGPRESTQMDMTGVGAAAKLGKVSANEAIEPFIRKHGLQRRMGTHLPKVGKWTEKDIVKYIAEQKSLKRVKIGGVSIDWGNSDWGTVLRDAIEYEKDISRTASQLSAKLQCFQWVTIFDTIQRKGKLQEFLSVLYFGAKKQYDTAGPFLKVA
jgi:hypothetical protein|tara:strand:+ start:29393 stop:30769 length:1377 start_codon:yes stop_codon:yes gene_type:complete